MAVNNRKLRVTEKAEEKLLYSEYIAKQIPLYNKGVTIY